jgi:hypothetical protein
MLARRFGLALVLLALAAFGAGRAGEKEGGVKDGIKEKEKASDFKALAGVVKSVDAVKGTFVITTSDDKQRMLRVTESTKFLGPNGGNRGMGKAGLKDDTMVPGSQIRVTLAADNRTAREVQLPRRPSPGKDKEK